MQEFKLAQPIILKKVRYSFSDTGLQNQAEEVAILKAFPELQEYDVSKIRNHSTRQQNNTPAAEKILIAKLVNWGSKKYI